MKTDFPAEWHALFNAALNGELTEADNERLAALLKSSAAARQLWFLYNDNEASLSELPPRPESISQVAPVAKVSGRWIQWRPLAAAAAGLVIGLFSATVLANYAISSQVKTVTLLWEGFESGPAPLVTGMPLKPGVWSGDYTEVVGEQPQQGVKPASGQRMLRFLRADYEGKAQPEGSYFSDLYRLVDLRPFRAMYGDGGAVVQLSGMFNAYHFPDDEKYGCTMALYAMDTATVTNGSTHYEAELKESLAMARNSRVLLDRDPKTWQPANVELRLPPNTDFLLIHISVDHSNRAQRRLTFDGHYLDDVRLTLGRRPLLR